MLESLSYGTNAMVLGPLGQGKTQYKHNIKANLNRFGIGLSRLPGGYLVNLLYSSRT